jgi:alkylation response protein AidB-like acyl-CoA dehydrogenase
VTPPVWKFGTEDQKRRYLAPAIAGEKIGALAITEPGAGSDVASIATRAERVDGGFVVNGEKTYITNGVRAAFYVTAVKTTAQGGHHGLSFLIVDAGEGVSAAKLDKLGWHASDTATVFSRTPSSPRRTCPARSTRAFASSWPTSSGSGCSWPAAPSGRWTSRWSARSPSPACVQLHGGAGYMREYEIRHTRPPGRGSGMARDARLGPIGGGTDEVMKEILGKVMGL